MDKCIDKCQDESISRAAFILQVSEYNIFELAYKKWYASEPDDKYIGREFGSYFDGGSAPYWVRDFSRKVVSSCDGDACDFEAFGVHKVEVDQSLKALGQWYIIMLTILMTAFFYMVVNTPPL